MSVEDDVGGGDGEACLCADCGVETFPEGGPSDHYMVTPRIWACAGMNGADRAGFLCIGCLDSRMLRRMGRLLAPEDFLPIPVNYPGYYDDGERLYGLKAGMVAMIDADLRRSLERSVASFIAEDELEDELLG